MTFKPGLSMESAASVIMRDAVVKHMHTFAHVIKADHAAGKSMHAVYVDALAGTIALMIAGGQASKDELIAATATLLVNSLERDLQGLRSH